MSRAEQTDEATTDGRVMRSQRSRTAIANALYELVGEGHLEPTAQQVAERADVGIRSVFRHFSDMDALYATLNARISAEVTPSLAPTPPEGDVRERAIALVTERVALFERIAPYKRAAVANARRSRFLTEQNRKLVAQLRARLIAWLPEVGNAPPETLEALDLATSFEAWNRLRSEQRLGRARARAAMQHAVLALIDPLDDRRE